MNDAQNTLIELFEELKNKSWEYHPNATIQKEFGYSSKKQEFKASLTKGNYVTVLREIFFEPTSKNDLIPINEVKMILKIMHEIKQYNVFWNFKYTGGKNNNVSKTINGLRKRKILFPTQNNEIHIINPLILSFKDPKLVIASSLNKLAMSKFRVDEKLCINLLDLKYREKLDFGYEILNS